jgi:threonine/homoserine/homoserine lactone efflux protein
MFDCYPAFMTYAQNVWLYAVLLFGIIIVPGMDMFFVMANGLTGGRQRALMATGGIMLGGICHTVFGAVGVSAILKAAPHAMSAVLVAGAAYMMWIGFSLLQSSIRVEGIGARAASTDGAAFRQGLITCLLNPKAYLFVVAVYPQFIRAEYGPVLPQAAVMGFLTFVTQASIYGSLGIAAARSRDFLIGSPLVTIWIGRAAGGLFVIAAIATLWSWFSG